MDMASIIIAAMFLVRWQMANGYSLTNVTDSVLGCSHNNTRFANGSFVPTLEPCLNCKCINANLICALRVCPEQVFPPPRGCVVVQKKNSCCSYITCSKLHNTYKDQDKRIVTHDRKWYEQNIRNRLFSQNALQRRIDDSDEELGNEKMCVHNGTVYRSGSAMTTSSLCTYCYCIEGKQKCIQPKCTLPAKIGCEPILIDSSCCPIRYDCSENKITKARYNIKYNRRKNYNKHYLRMTSRMQRSRGCLVDSTFYPEGHKLPADQSNPCEICFCIGGSKRCTPKKCAPTIRNCKPIIPDGQCCPSSYDCNYKTARGFTSRQYSDIFSLLFGNEEKENSTASWDYDTETETINTDLNTKNEKGFLDAINDSLKYADGNEQSSEQPSFIPNKTAEPVLKLPSYNVSDEDDDDEEEISILDFFLKGENAFISTTLKPFTYNITGKPLLNGMTNSPMQIQPIFPDDMKNESLKFSMLPISLYNMVKDDGSVMFDNDKKNQIQQLKSSYSIEPLEIASELTPVKNKTITQTTTINVIAAKSTTTTTTTKPIHHTTTVTSNTYSSKRITPNSPIPTTATEEKSNDTTKLNKTETIIVKNINKSNNTTEKVTTSLKIESTTIPSAKPVVHVYSSTTEKILLLLKEDSSTKPTVTSKKPTSTPTTISAYNFIHPITSQGTTSIPKIAAIQINSNPSILETDIGYDYSDSTLPPSLPNLKIIPFLPTDAVKNIIHKNDGYRPNFNYYNSNQNSYTGHDPNIGNTANSPFNIKPIKYPTYNSNIADDRIDYDSYKVPADHVESLDYINVFATSGNKVPASFQLNVNSKLDYSSDQNTVPTKMSINKNLTVKPPLPPFEPEHEYDLYNISPQLQLNPHNIYDHSVNSHTLNGPYPVEHNYDVPHFVTMPPIRESENKDTVFSYGSKNKFIPPVKTEGGFIPKRTTVENYIPLHGSSHIKDLTETPTTKLYQNDENIPTDSLNQTSFDKNNISISKDDSIMMYNDTLLGVDLLGPYKKQSEEYEVPSDNIQIENNVLFSNVPTSSSLKYISNPSTSSSTTFATTLKTPPKNMTNNNAIPLKLITILNNTKKENPAKFEIPQRKNNKIIDPTDEPLIEDTNVSTITTEMAKTDSENDENLSFLRDVFLSSINRPTIGNDDASEEQSPKPPLFLSRPINKFEFSSFSSLNSLESKSKHNFQANPIRSELDLFIPELNKNKHTNELSHTNNFSSGSYQVLTTDDSNIANTESYVVNPVDVDKLKQHQSSGETKIFTPPHKEHSGLLKLAGCNIYGRMYRVGRIIVELSSSCLECRCTEVGVSCTPLNC